MGYASGWRRTEGPQAGEWFLNAYYYSFDATGVDAIDELLSAVAYAGKRYHGTDMWTEPTEDEDGKPGPSSVDEIQMAAQRAAAQLAEARAENERLRHYVEHDEQGKALRAENERLKMDVEHYAKAIIWEGDMIVTQTRYEQTRAENERLTAELARSKDDCETMIHQRDEAQNLRGKAEAECEELRADVVWVVKEYTAVGNHPKWLPTSNGWVQCKDGVWRAVREARNGLG